MTSPQVSGPPAEVAAIDRVRSAHIDALNKGDAGTWAGLFTEGGVQMPPHFSSNFGRGAILTWSRAFLAPFGVDFSLSVDEVRVTDDWAFERGKYKITLTPKAGGDPIRDAGKYITIYERQSDGTWKVGRDIWNSDNPLPGMR